MQYPSPAGLYVPATQSIGKTGVEPSMHFLPAGHNWHSPDPAVLYWPSGHFYEKIWKTGHCRNTLQDSITYDYIGYGQNILKLRKGWMSTWQDTLTVWSGGKVTSHENHWGIFG